MPGNSQMSPMLHDHAYDDAPTVILVGASADGARALTGMVTGLGGRVIATVTAAGAIVRLEQQAALDAVVLDLDGGVEEELAEQLLDAVAEGVRGAQFLGVVIVPPTLIDLAAARIGHLDVPLLSAPEAAELRTVIAGALARRAPRLNDISAEAREPRLRQLSEEVSRIARMLATLSSEAPAGVELLPACGHEARPGRPALEIVDAALVRAMIRARRLRDHYFQDELFADAAWDMLLDLTAAQLERRQVAVSSLCIAAAVPPTTALRWIKALTDKGLFVRIADPNDGRRVFIELADRTADAMLNYLAAAKRVTALPV